jgi:hypothetical protein
MARISTTDYTPPPVITAGTHAVMIDGCRFGSTQSGKTFLEVSLTVCDPHAACYGARTAIKQFGMVPGSSGVVAVEQSIRDVSAHIRPHQPKIQGDTQPYEDFDWEDEHDVSAVLVCGVVRLTFTAKEDSKFLDVYFGGALPVTAADMDTFRAGPRWEEIRSRAITARQIACRVWRENLEAARAGTAAPAAAAVNPATDDTIPF